MRAALLFIVVLCLLGMSAARIKHTYKGALNHRLGQSLRADPPMPVFNTPLDHNGSTNATMNLRYLVNSTFFNGNGPVLFMLGGEGPISGAYVSGHFIINDHAAVFGGLIVALEHRYYGDSLPNGPGSDTPTELLQFLSSQQALADATLFQQYIVSQFNLTSQNQWIVYGGSYSGCLSAWAKLKYPTLYAGAISASAPVEALLDFYQVLLLLFCIETFSICFAHLGIVFSSSQYMEVVQRSVGPTCAASIHDAVKVAEKLAESPEGKQKLHGLFQLCAPLENDKDLSNFFSTLSDPIAEAVQYSDDNNAAGAYDIKLVCSNFSSGADPLATLAALVVAKDGNGTCVDVSYASYLESMKASSAGRSWLWQTCTEFGFYQTGEATDQPFSPRISLEFNVDQCQDIYGIAGMTPNVDFTNNYYGSKQIQTTNTFFTNGRVDPWHILGVEAHAQPGPGTSISIMDGTAHCADLYAPRDSDLDELTKTRSLQVQAMSTWLQSGEN
jgi:pimeloyl-ACP methyl ester carboxylesterase